jgi:hypothetical protein
VCGSRAEGCEKSRLHATLRVSDRPKAYSTKAANTQCENGRVKNLPRFLLVKQHFPDLRLTNIREAVHNELAASGLAGRLAPGSQVAIGVGSRGIANLSTIVRSAVEFFKEIGHRPFLFPAMGSHGGATGEGQRQVLARYGVDEASMGCPVVSQMDAVATGEESGVGAFADKAAMASDGILLINRVKWHTSFQGTVESGVTKMASIGLGKIDGARCCHRHARSLGMEKVIRSVARQNLATGKILGGLAILEDASHHTARIVALPAEGLIEGEEKLLETVRSWMGRIPVPALDILIVDEIGKDISGTGMDTKVVNRGVIGQYNPWPATPRIERIYLRDLSAATHGNAVGIGMADVVHDRLVAKVDPESTWVNAVTSGSLAAVRTPIHYASDRKCIETLAQTVGKAAMAEVTMGWILNSLELGLLAMSENLRGQIEANPMLEILGPAFPLEFDGAGNLGGLKFTMAA